MLTGNSCTEYREKLSDSTFSGRKKVTIPLGGTPVRFYEGMGLTFPPMTSTSRHICRVVPVEGAATATTASKTTVAPVIRTGHFSPLSLSPHRSSIDSPHLCLRGSEDGMTQVSAIPYSESNTVQVQPSKHQAEHILPALAGSDDHRCGAVAPATRLRYARECLAIVARHACASASCSRCW